MARVPEMRGAVLLRPAAKIDVIFRCLWSHGALVIDGVQGKPVCENALSWRAKGERIAPDRIKVEKGGHCPGCGYMGEAMIPDEYAGCTVEVAG